MQSTRRSRASFLGEHARPFPRLSDALGAGGGLLVAIGVLLISVDLIDPGADGGDISGVPGSLAFLVLLAVGYALLLGAPPTFSPAAVTVIAASIPAIFGFLILPDADEFSDYRGFFALTILGWVACFVAPRSRARPVFVGLAAVLLYYWVLGEVGDTNAYALKPIPSPPYVTPADYVDAMQQATGSSANDAATAPARLRQQVTLDDLDPNDPLYPLAQECADGDDEACDQLYSRSAPGSDLETFAENCGGRGTPEFNGTCSAEDDDFGGDFEFEDELEPGPLPEVTPFESDDDQSTQLGAVSLIFGVAYLASKRVLDANGYTRLGTAFVLPAGQALVLAALLLGIASESWIIGGVLTMLVGLGYGISGYFGERRFTTWFGGITASVGALIIAIETSDVEENVDGDVDAIGPGLVVMAFGIAVIVLAFFVARLIEQHRWIRLSEEPETPPSSPVAQWSPTAPPPLSVPPVAAPPPEMWEPRIDRGEAEGPEPDEPRSDS
jgi:hypothetical protein